MTFPVYNVQWSIGPQVHSRKGPSHWSFFLVLFLQDKKNREISYSICATLTLLTFKGVI